MADTHYVHGPVHERAICVFAPIAEDTFLDRLDRWREAAASGLPVCTRFADRDIVLPNDQSEPATQRVSIRHRFWNEDPAKAHADWCVQLSPDRFVVNLRRNGLADQRGFNELRDFFCQWYPKWLDCFGNPEAKRVQLEYWNRVNKHTIPDCATDKYIEVKDIFTVFASTPMPPCSSQYVVPYRYEANWDAVLDERDYRLSASIRAVASLPLTLQAHFLAGGGVPTNGTPVPELDNLHRLLLGVFDVFFTPKAKELFR